MVDTAPAAGSDAEPVPEGDTPRWAWLLASAVVLVPLVRMGQLVWRAHPLPYNDYWPMIDSMLTAEGGFDASGLFELRNEHPLAIAKLLYWINLQLTGGSNVALGFVVIGIVLGQLAVVAVLSRDLARHWRLAPPLVTAAAAYLLFGRQGAWHFVKSMSGAAWLTANLFTLLAVWAQLRQRQVLALVFAALATLSYGTGLAAWPVLVAVGLLAGVQLRRLLPVVGLGILATLWVHSQATDIGKTAGDRPPLRVWMARAAEVIGAYLFPGRRVTAIRVGEILIAVGVVGAAVVLLRRRTRTEADDVAAAPWVGVVAYGVGMGLLVAAARNTYLWSGTAGRYSAIGALTCVGVVGVVLALAPRRSVVGRALQVGSAVGVAVLCAAVASGGDQQVRRLDTTYATQDLLAVALEARIFDQSRLWLGDIEQLDAEGIEERLRRSGHDFRLVDRIDCGLFGSHVDPEEVARTLPAGVTAGLRLEDGGRSVPRGVVFDGWVAGAAIDCALLVDAEGEVVGAGGSGSARRGYGGPSAFDGDGREWFSGIGPATDEPTVLLRLDGDDGFVELAPTG